MPRPTLATGDIWDASLANASITPFIAETVEAADAAGGIPPVEDDQLSSTPGQIKSNFYGWYDRIKLAVTSGLTVGYSGSTILLPSGATVTLNSGTAIVPNNTTSYIYVNDSGAVAVAPALPDICLPLARVVASGGSITSLVDLRYQVADQVRPVNLPSIQSPWSPGDMKVTFRQTPEPGWLLCQGQLLTVSAFPALFSAIGYSYGGSGATFQLPDMRGRVLVGAGQGAGLTNRPYGSSGGAENKQLTIAELPSHNHGIVDFGHSHGITDNGHAHIAIDSGHSHTILDPGHQHFINDPGHFHRLATVRGAALNADPDDGVGAELSVQGQGGFPATTADTTNIAIRNAATGITNSVGYAVINVNAGPTGVSVNNGQAGIAIQAQGGSAVFSMMNPYVAGNYMIKY